MSWAVDECRRFSADFYTLYVKSRTSRRRVPQTTDLGVRGSTPLGRANRSMPRGERRLLKALASFFFFRQQEARHHHEMTANTADEGFVIDDFPANRVQPHFCHPAFALPERVFLLPVETLAAPHGAGHVATVRDIDHRAPYSRLSGHRSSPCRPQPGAPGLERA